MKIGIGILLLFFVASLQAQNITGKVTDNENQPVDGVTIVLQAIDSTYISASISEADGTFVLESRPEEYRLIVQHKNAGRINCIYPLL
ncbi:carboxypeptidase-like regulatory domain-containing protein [Parabacteroides sp.]